MAMPRVHQILRIKGNSLSINKSKSPWIVICMVTWWLELLELRRSLFKVTGSGALNNSHKCNTSNSSNRSLEQASHHPSLLLRSHINTNPRNNNRNHSTLSLTISIFRGTHRLSSKTNPPLNNINIALHRPVDISSNRA